MSKIIKTIPQNEKELVEIKKYIENAKQMNLDLQARVKNVGLHLELMDDHMYAYSDEQ
jgi:hypothetical protein